MAFVRSLEKRYAAALASGSLDRALARWKAEDSSFLAFDGVEELVRLCRSQQSGREAKEQVIDALCERAGAGDEESALLLMWLFIGTLRRVRKMFGDSPLSDEDLEAEMLAGFWDGVRKDTSTRPSARIFYAVLDRAREAVAQARKVSVEAPGGELPKARQPSPGVGVGLILHQAEAEGILTPDDLRLIRATRLEGWRVSEIAESLGESREAVSMRRKRAEDKLARWLSRPSRHIPVTSGQR